MANEIVYLTTGDDWLANYGGQLASISPAFSMVETGSPAAEVDAALSRAETLIIDPALVSNALLDRVTRLKFLQLTSTDIDDLDLAGLEERGITIAGVNEAAAPAVATHVLDLAVTAARLIGHPGVSGIPTYPELAAKVVCVVGFGYAGIETVRQLQGLRCEFRVMDVRTSPQGIQDELGARRQTLDRLLVESDYVILLVPLTPQTRGMLDLRDFRIMKPEAILINGSDPGVIDNESLLKALDEGLLAGAGITYRDGELESHPKIVALSYPDILRGDAAERAVGLIADNLAAVGRGDEPRSRVESITFPVVGDPTFWSSRFAPRRL